MVSCRITRGLEAQGTLRRGSSLRCPAPSLQPGPRTQHLSLGPEPSWCALASRPARRPWTELGSLKIRLASDRSAPGSPGARGRRWAEKTREPGALRTGSVTDRRHDGRVADRRSGCLPRTRRYGSCRALVGPLGRGGQPSSELRLPVWPVRNKLRRLRAFPGFLRRGPCACFRFLLSFSLSRSFINTYVFPLPPTVLRGR